MQVWKYQLGGGVHLAIAMPQGAKVLTVQVQHGVPCIWALVDPDAPKEVREFRLAGTGLEITAKEAERYVGTFQLSEGRFLGHLFEITEKK